MLRPLRSIQGCIVCETRNEYYFQPTWRLGTNQHQILAQVTRSSQEVVIQAFPNTKTQLSIESQKLHPTSFQTPLFVSLSSLYFKQSSLPIRSFCPPSIKSIRRLRCFPLDYRSLVLCIERACPPFAIHVLALSIVVVMVIVIAPPIQHHNLILAFRICSNQVLQVYQTSRADGRHAAS
jgi:hypothetical protein